jgi:predicted dehydrogenase
MNSTVKNLVILLCSLIMLKANAQKPITVVIAGLNHDHVHGILNQYSKGGISIVGIAEPNKALWKKYGDLYHIPASLFYTDLKSLVLLKKPDAVLGYNAAANHVDVVEICAHQL